MKSLQELINDADDIQKRLAQHKIDLYEYAESLKENHVAVDIDKLMTKASHCKIERHILQDINDEYVIGAYLQLLLSVAQVNITDDKGKNHPALYACRIAAALPKIPDMNMLFQSSIILDEKGISDCVDALIQHKLADIFVFDALVLTCSYDTGNERKLEYIAELATLMNIGENMMNEILIIVDGVVGSSRDLEHNFEYIEFEKFIHIFHNLKNNANINISSNHYLLISYVKQTKAKFDRNSMFASKKYILLNNVVFDYKTNAISDEPIVIEICNCDKVSILNSSFENTTIRLCDSKDIRIENSSFINLKRSAIVIDDCGEISILGSSFENVTIERNDRISADSMYNALIALRKAGTMLICDCNFKNIVSWNSESIILFSRASKNIIVNNSSFINCNSEDIGIHSLIYCCSRSPDSFTTKKCMVKNSAPLDGWRG